MVPRSRTLALLAVAALALVGAGTVAADDPYADPANDTVGWEDGRWHDEPLPVDQSDGLNETEEAALLARSLARIEVVKDTEVEVNTTISLRPESEYEFCGDGPSESKRLFENVRWEAGFAVGEDRDAAALNACEPPVAYYGGEGYGGVVVLAEDPDAYRLDGRVLVHELAHAVQPDAISPFDRETTDGSQARAAVVEGEANWVTGQYARRCGEEWDCERHPEFVRSDVTGAEYAFRVGSLFGYAAGPGYVDDVVDREGYDALAARFGDPPATTEQVIHRTAEPNVSVRVASDPRGGWSRVESDRLGEAGVYTTFWYASRAHDAGVVDPAAIYASPDARRLLDGNSLAGLDGPDARLNYTHPVSAGWAGDRLVAYANGSASGYVWATAWDSEADAREFHRAYLQVLRSLGARESRDSAWVVPDGPFADAFRVVRDGRRVVVVNAPTVRGTAAVHPATAPQGVTVTPTPTPSWKADSPTGTATGSPVASPGGGTATDQPGFGALAALVALAVLSAACRAAP